MFYRFFCSPQVKRNSIIGKKHGIHRLLLDLPNDLRLQEIWKYQENLKILLNYSDKPYSQNENFVSATKKLRKNRN